MLKRFSSIWNNFISYTDRSGLEDALDKQVSKSKLFVESLRRNHLGPGSNPWPTQDWKLLISKTIVFCDSQNSTRFVLFLSFLIYRKIFSFQLKRLKKSSIDLIPKPICDAFVGKSNTYLFSCNKIQIYVCHIVILLYM